MSMLKTVTLCELVGCRKVHVRDTWLPGPEAVEEEGGGTSQWGRLGQGDLHCNEVGWGKWVRG